MSFTSLEYLIFLPLVFLVVRVLPHRAQNLTLLGVSYVFYAWVHPWFLWLICGVTAVNYIAARLMQARPAAKKLSLIMSLSLSLGVLGVFKYFDFFVGSLIGVLSALGIEGGLTTLGIFLPVGISFYVFQGMGYTIDVYRGDLEARRSFVDVALFVAFFPQLVAGPIERAGHLLPQIEAPRRLRAMDMQEGLLLLVWGLFKKLVIADNTALIVDKVFALNDPSFSLVWVGIFAFAVQILADFSGYTDIARGTARLLGFQLMRNFDRPYSATSPAEFWRRWHMSLSFWLRDYLYIPLGGSRTTKWKSFRNVLTTFLLCGLWHGAAWNFVVWGAYHGILISLQRLLPKRHADRRDWLKPLKILGMFGLTCFGWLIFRETDMHWLKVYLTLSPWGESSYDRGVALYFFNLALIFSMPIWGQILLGACLKGAAENSQWRQRLAGARVMALPVLVLAILLLRSSNPSSFIYFQF